MKNTATIILFCSVLVLSSGTWLHKTESVQKLSDTVSVNVCKIRFKTATGKPVDFKMGMYAASLTDIHVLIDEAYVFENVSVILVRGKRPVSAVNYQNKKEIVIEKSVFASAQPGDRICIDIAEVVKEVDGVKTPVELDIPVFNIPLN